MPSRVSVTASGEVRPTANRTICWMNVWLTIAFAFPLLTQAQNLVANQFQFIEGVTSRPASDFPLAEVGRIDMSGGYVAFVEQRGGEVGIVAVGVQPQQVMRAVTANNDYTALEIYKILGGNPRSTPSLLQRDHDKQSAKGSRSTVLPSLASLTVGPVASLQGQSALGQVSGGACGLGSMSTWDYFNYWWKSGYFIPGIGTLEDIGVHGHHDTGIWNQGAANLNLGSTSAGAALVCFPESESHLDGVRITVQEYYGNGLWLDLWSDFHIYEGAGYGYWFKGQLVHRIRVLIRDRRPANQQNPVIGPFYWAGSY